jgi:multidrug efflux pump subunit AcrA (membrane-fusion protein)
VDVVVVTDLQEGVLAVPVTALVALLGGGYAVEVPDAQTTRLVPVEPGMYADGYVEIAEGDLAEGDTVLVPQ